MVVIRPGEKTNLNAFATFPGGFGYYSIRGTGVFVFASIVQSNSDMICVNGLLIFAGLMCFDN